MGAELLRLLLGHPRVTLTGVTSERLAGEPLSRVYPHLRGLTELSFHDLDANWLSDVADVVFLALPHKTTAKVVIEMLDAGYGGRIVDMSGDFRLRDVAAYEKFYGVKHPKPSMLTDGQFIYGLPELNRAASSPARS